jgi:predicted nucleic acid-binding protein
MKNMLIYMDVCCFNRPFDDQRSPSVYLETEAKLFVQDAVKQGKLDICWSYMLEYENAANPDRERRVSIQHWQALAKVVILENERIIQQANALHKHGLGAKDALHLACAIDTEADYFLTTDKGIMRKKHLTPELNIVNPIEFLHSIADQL